MRSRNWQRWIAACLILGGILLGSRITGYAQGTDKYYYWVGPLYPKGSPPPKQDSFVIEVNSTQRSQIEGILPQGHPPQFDGHIAAGSVSYNKNYHAAGHPAWDWHFYVHRQNLR